MKQTEREYEPHVPDWDEWQPPEYVGVFKKGQIVGFHCRNDEIARLQAVIVVRHAEGPGLRVRAQCGRITGPLAVGPLHHIAGRRRPGGHADSHGGASLPYRDAGPACTVLLDTPDDRLRFRGTAKGHQHLVEHDLVEDLRSGGGRPSARHRRVDHRHPERELGVEEQAELRVIEIAVVLDAGIGTASDAALTMFRSADSVESAGLAPLRAGSVCATMALWRGAPMQCTSTSHR